MKPCGMLWCALGLAPFFKHRWCNAVELGHLFFGANVGRQLDAMAIWVEEVDALEDSVVNRA